MTAPTPPASPAVEVIAAALFEFETPDCSWSDWLEYVQQHKSFNGMVRRYRDKATAVLAALAAPPTPRGEEVTQADRDAAADRLTRGHLPDRINSPIERTADKVRAGSMDSHAWVQAFARHRLAAVAKFTTPRAEIGDEARASIPEGFVLVPRELTHAMLDATCDTAADDEAMRSRWVALLDAAPKLAFAAATTAPAVGDGEEAAEAWLDRKVSPGHSRDRDYDADDMIDAFLAGAASKRSGCEKCNWSGLERFVGYGNNEETGPCSFCAATPASVTPDAGA